MNDKLKETFDQIHAEDSLKNQTKAFLIQKIRDGTNRKITKVKRLVPVAACVLFLLIGAHWLFFTPTVKISIDINPSIELGINRFDKVISVMGYNDDGRDLAKSLNITFLNYKKALDQIINSESIVTMLSKEEVMTIAVIGPDGKQCSRMLSDLETLTTGQKNMHSYHANSEEVSAAHQMGLSYGKYMAYLEIKALDPNITPEEIRNMTMSEIRKLLNDLKDGDATGAQSGNHKGHGHNHGENQQGSGGRYHNMQ